MKLRYAALSDVGRVRRDNQDAGYAGPHLLVIADGVGGAARGDVASSATVQELRRLDGRAGEVQGEDMLGALAGAIHRSHDRIAELVRESPEIEGTSSTVTAALFDGRQLAVGHVGDSRGYLLREGTLSQLTTDHTFVQSLVDEGRITEVEARVHPHRNLILRAVDGVHDPEPDVFVLDVAPGDRVMLCSDGCSGVVDDAGLTRLLSQGTPDHAVVSLVSAALDAGSSDNVTVVVADVVADDDPGVDDEETSAAAVTGPMLVGAAADQPRLPRPRAGRASRVSDTGELDPVRDDADEGAGRRGRSRGGEPGGEDDVDPEEMRYAPQPPRRFTRARWLAATAAVVVVLGLIGYAGYAWTQKQYYVADEGDTVAVFQGVEADLPGIAMHRVEEGSDLALDELPDYNARQVRDGISASSLDDARGIVSRLRRLATCPEPSTTTTPSPGPSLTATPSPTPSPTPRSGRTPSPNPSPSPSASSGPTDCTEAP